MHDKVHPHIATNWWDNMRIEVLPWPEQSPNPNPLEHVWDMLQHRNTPHMDNNPNVLQCRELLIAEWATLPHEIDKLILSMIRCSMTQRSHFVKGAFFNIFGSLYKF